MSSVLFEDGQFKQDNWPELEAEEDWGAFLERQGFIGGGEMGQENGFQIEILEGKVEGAWVVTFSLPFRYCVIRCYGWHNLIEMLSKLSPIILAGALQNGDKGTPFFRTANLKDSEQADW